jgi:hypothetical protein
MNRPMLMFWLCVLALVWGAIATGLFWPLVLVMVGGIVGGAAVALLQINREDDADA